MSKLFGFGLLVAENNCSLGPSISVSAPPEKQTSGVASAKEFTGGEENGSGKGGFHGLQER